jgi:hypothetical protein
MSELKKAFLEDSYTFKKILIEFLQAKKWEEFVCQMCLSDNTYGPVLLALLYYVFGGKENESTVAAASSSSKLHYEALKAPYEDDKSLSDFFKVLESRCNKMVSSDNRYAAPRKLSAEAIQQTDSL